MKESEKTNGRRILWRLVICLMLPILFIVGVLVGVNLDKGITLLQDNLSSWVSAFATVTIAVLTIVLAKETWALRLIQLSQMEHIRKDSIKPSISLYLKSNPVGFNFIDVHIENNGTGVAQNIKFNFININMDTQPVYDDFLLHMYKLTMLQKGIASLSAGEHRSSFLLSFIEFYEKHDEKSFDLVAEVNIEFEDIEGSKYMSKAFFNFAEYKGISELGGGDALHQIASHLKKIEEEMGKLSGGYKKIKTDIYTSEDRKQEREAREKQRRELNKPTSDN